MRYKSYEAVVEYDDSARLFHGEVLNVRGVITFQGRTVDELEQAFRESVEDYIDFCAKQGLEPDKPYTGEFLIRANEELHRRLAISARRQRKSFNAFIVETLETAMGPSGSPGSARAKKGLEKSRKQVRRRV
jgi:predicted HicB family RNase H-like nuclease